MESTVVGFHQLLITLISKMWLRNLNSILYYIFFVLNSEHFRQERDISLASRQPRRNCDEGDHNIRRFKGIFFLSILQGLLINYHLLYLFSRFGPCVSKPRTGCCDIWFSFWKANRCGCNGLVSPCRPETIKLTLDKKQFVILMVVSLKPARHEDGGNATWRADYDAAI